MVDVRLPTGTVTFLFTDIEGSTALAKTLGALWPEQLDTHSRILRQVVSDAGGIEVSTNGDAFFFVFEKARDALHAAVEAQKKIEANPWPDGGRLRVRIGLHTGVGEIGGAAHGGIEDYVGLDVHLAARVEEAGHGGQVILSEATKALVADSGDLRDLGEHRLRGIDRPVRMYQVVIPGLQHQFPHLRTLTAPIKIPEQLTTLIGRSQEIAEAVRLLDEFRLITLTGPGGTGKTRLAIAVAMEMAPRFPDGVFFVSLSAVSDPELVSSAILGELGIAESAGMPEARLVETLADRELLLVLDNFEQLVEAAPLVTRLLGAAPKLRVLVTSRAALQVYGEHELLVEPLAVPSDVSGPDPAELTGYPSIALFVDRARAVRPGFRLDEANAAAVAEIAAALDGLPLALELAAARVRLLSPQAIRDRLGDRLSLLSGGARDLPARQQTLRGAIAWSYDLLSPMTQRLMRCLSVFIGGFGLEQAEELVDTTEALDGLGELVDQSLLHQGELAGGPRFRMLETIRQFAVEQLETAGEDNEARARHLDLFLALAEEAAPRLLASDQADWLDRLERDHDNLRAALEWAVAQGDAEASGRMVWALWRFWQIRGHLYEGARRCFAVLDLPPGDPRVRCRALEAAGGIAYWRGDLDNAQVFYASALSLARQIGDPPILGDALYNAAFGLGMSETSGPEELEKGQTYLAEARQIFEDLGDRVGVARVLWGQGTLVWGAYWGQDIERALEIYEETSALYRDLDDVFQYGWSRRMEARSLLELGRVDEAVVPMRDALEVFTSARDTSALTLIVNDVALMALKRGDEPRALRLLGAANSLRATSGTDLVRFRANVSEDLDKLADSQFPGASGFLNDGGAMSIDELLAYVQETIA